MQSSSQSGNLQAYLWHIYGLLRRSKDEKSTGQLINALVLTRLVVHHITEHYAPEFWHSVLDPASGPGDRQPEHSTSTPVCCGKPPDEGHVWSAGQESLALSLSRAVLELLLDSAHQ